MQGERKGDFNSAIKLDSQFDEAEYFVLSLIALFQSAIAPSRSSFLLWLIFVTQAAGVIARGVANLGKQVVEARDQEGMASAKADAIQDVLDRIGLMLK